MRVTVKPSVLRETKWYEYAVRFVFGGLVTAFADVIAKKYGPVVGGLFLAFPPFPPVPPWWKSMSGSAKRGRDCMEAGAGGGRRAWTLRALPRGASGLPRLAAPVGTPRAAA